jgi:hypothetical protein
MERLCVFSVTYAKMRRKNHGEIPPSNTSSPQEEADVAPGHLGDHNTSQIDRFLTSSRYARAAQGALRKQNITRVYASLFATSSLLVDVIGFSLTFVFRKEWGAVTNGPRGDLDAMKPTRAPVVADRLRCDAEAVSQRFCCFQLDVLIHLFQHRGGPSFDYL